MINLLWIISLMMSLPAAATISSQRQLTENVTWQSCNSSRICYSLKAQIVDIGFIANRFYASPVEIQIFRKETDGSLKRLRQINASEGRWDYERNQWLLIIKGSRGEDREYVFVPDRLTN